jgi:hypothetical protein
MKTLSTQASGEIRSVVMRMPEARHRLRVAQRFQYLLHSGHFDEGRLGDVWSWFNLPGKFPLISSVTVAFFKYKLANLRAWIEGQRTVS